MRDESGDVEGGRERQSDGDGYETNGIRGGEDGATSGARSNSKRVDTGPLAEDEASQYKRRKRESAGVPELYTPPPIHHRRPCTHPNPPRRRG
jgi:hypothetical protein